jgi:hypothetical protein
LTNKNNSLVIRFTLEAPDYTTPSAFFELTEVFNNDLNKNNISLKIMNKEYTLSMICEKMEDYFAMDINEDYFSKSTKLIQMITDLKADVTKSYKFENDSIDLVKIKVEPNFQIEFSVKNTLNDTDFCRKSFYLNSDVYIFEYINS